MKYQQIEKDVQIIVNNVCFECNVRDKKARRIVVAVMRELKDIENGRQKLFAGKSKRVFEVLNALEITAKSADIIQNRIEFFLRLFKNTHRCKEAVEPVAAIKVCKNGN